jgi:hypothetical protein
LQKSQIAIPKEMRESMDEGLAIIVLAEFVSDSL